MPETSVSQAAHKMRQNGWRFVYEHGHVNAYHQTAGGSFTLCSTDREWDSSKTALLKAFVEELNSFGGVEIIDDREARKK